MTFHFDQINMIVFDAELDHLSFKQEFVKKKVKKN